MKIPGDKSLSHRVLIFASLAKGKTEIKNLSTSIDVMSTLNLLKKIGVDASSEYVVGRNKVFLESKDYLDCGNAGTLMRLMMGVLVGQNFSSTLIGDLSLSRRPMKRVATLLEKMGAKIELANQDFAPVRIHASKIKGGILDIPVPSAQLKSALLLAGLHAEEDTVLTGKIHSRDHTERLFKYFGAQILTSNNSIILKGGTALEARHFNVPGDASAAAFWVIWALLKKKNLVLENILLNEERIKYIDILKRSGAHIELEVIHDKPEKVGIIKVFPSKLNGIRITKDEIQYVIDEIPILSLLASQIEGESVFLDASELRLKESDRISGIQKMFESLKMDIKMIDEDSFLIPGSQKILSGKIDSLSDHRIAMTGLVAKSISEKDILINDLDCVAISDPYFINNILEYS